MTAGRKNLHRSFARVSPVFVALGVAVLCAFSCVAAAEGSGTVGNSTGKRQAASAQFIRAEDQRGALNSKAPNKRTLAEYKQVVSSYRRVYLITPHAPEVPDALLAVAELYIEMGDRFGRSYYQSAVDSYRFLMHEYPTSKYGQDAMLRIAQLEKDQLGDAALASKTFGEFLKKYPHSPKKREAQEALAELALLQSNDNPAPPKSAEAEAAPATSGKSVNDAADIPRTTTADASTTSSGGIAGKPHVRRISTSATAESTRVTIDLDDSVKYSSARIRNPDRIFFDLQAAKLTPELARTNLHVEGDLLTSVRVAQNHAGVVRVVLDVNGVKDYTATLASNPPELVIDLYRDEGLRAAKAKNASAPPVIDPAIADVAVTDPNQKTAPGIAAHSTANPPAATAHNAVQSTAVQSGPTNPALLPSSTRANGHAKSLKPVSTKPDLIQPAATPTPTRDGQATLTRALGLKIGRIVIDAGHGGHDTGTIGPTGLMEKDLCLDVAVRLGKIVQQRLPGADVVYTRSDDTFVPLEERTRIANEAKADLFISIHANSSHDHGARGVETYYLNLKGSPDAMEVAARENATSQESVHDLEDLVKKIARSEKIDESREFAADIQESLAKRIQKTNKTVKDRGVRKAPFVVLIGADMPSILTEISFLSNPADEQLLKKPEHRQKVAEGLYQGVASYLQSLNSMTVNLPKLPLKNVSERSASMASVEQSRNPQ
jgi:N-acetylmuramoyl-L-alanine amidase